MSKHVPEANASDTESLMTLHDALIGNAAYAHARQFAGNGIAPLLAAVVNRTTSPTHFVTTWDSLAKDLRSVGRLLAKLHRDGNRAACKELLGSLRDSTYIMQGETLPPEKTTPLTLVMLDPPRTLALLEWMLRCEHHEEELRAALCGPWQQTVGRVHNDLKARTTLNPEGRIVSDRVDSYSASTYSLRLFEAFPQLRMVKGKKVLSGAKHDWYFSSHLARHRAEWRDPFAAAWASEGIELAAPPKAYPLVLDLHQLAYRVAVTSIDDVGPVARVLPWPEWPKQSLFLVEGDQADVLQSYPRALRSRIGTWQFHAPSSEVHLGDETHSPLTIGLHPAAEQDRWAGGRSAFVSRGLSHDLGAVLLSRFVQDHEYKSFDSYSTHSVAARAAAPFRVMLVPGAPTK